ncbi:MAG: ATP-binding cassette domain-containing protein, partial [Acidobacteria bacterium]|nr:ATP-binding cassette domain-containing protein [Candidatus Polarisedimenticola svalbardensis]
MAAAIELRGVRKTFGAKVAVDSLDLTVPEGGLYGFIGPNGAGKTTTIRMIMSILFSDEGEVQVLGHGSALDAKDRIGYLPEERGVYKKMKVWEFLRFMAVLKGVDGSQARGLVKGWLEKVGLGEVEQKKCEELSKGMQQKIQFIAAVIHKPDLLILDEPFSGLDPVNMRLLRDLVLEEHGRGATVIFSTHVMVQAEQICENVVMIHEGRKRLDDTLGDVRRRFDPRTIRFEPLGDAADVPALKAVQGVTGVRLENGAYEIALGEGVSPADAIARLAAASPASGIELHRPSLEDIFIAIVQEDAADAEAAEQLRASVRAGAALGGAR